MITLFKLIILYKYEINEFIIIKNFMILKHLNIINI